MRACENWNFGKYTQTIYAFLVDITAIIITCIKRSIEGNCPSIDNYRLVVESILLGLGNNRIRITCQQFLNLC
jgi:hypothetical protein